MRPYVYKKYQVLLDMEIYIYLGVLNDTYYFIHDIGNYDLFNEDISLDIYGWLMMVKFINPTKNIVIFELQKSKVIYIQNSETETTYENFSERFTSLAKLDRNIDDIIYVIIYNYKRDDYIVCYDNSFLNFCIRKKLQLLMKKEAIDIKDVRHVRLNARLLKQQMQS